VFRVGQEKLGKSGKERKNFHKEKGGDLKKILPVNHVIKWEKSNILYKVTF